MYSIRNRKYFTLIEILIVLALMTLTLSATALSVNRLIGQEKFFSSVKRVVDRLQLVQDLMVIQNADSSIQFTNHGGEWHLEAKTDDFLSAAIRKEIQAPLLLKNMGEISLLNLEGQAIDDNSINFWGNGQIITPCVITLTSADKQLQRFIFLPGFPRPINSKTAYDEPPVDTNRTEESRELYPHVIQESLQKALPAT